MASDSPRPPGSALGRAAIDWERAFAYYASLPPQTRSYQAVADEFGVSVRTVERHGRNERWRQRLQEINAQVAAETNAALGNARADHLVDLAKLIQASLVGYADKLRRGDVRMNPADLQRLHKLWQDLNDELGATNGSTNTEQHPPTVARAPEDTAAVIAALRDSGALAAFGLRADDSTAAATK